MARISNLRGYQLWLVGRSQPKPSKPEMIALIRERLRNYAGRQEHREARRKRIRDRERERERAAEQMELPAS